MNTVLQSHYPTTNPILAGIAFIENGGDPESAIWDRDQLLVQPELFVCSAWEALAWILPDHTDLAFALADQIQVALSACPTPVRQLLLKTYSTQDLSLHQKMCLDEALR